MTTIFFISGKKVTRKAVKELVGEERLTTMLRESKETYKEDPLIENDYWLGTDIGMLTIEFR